MICVAMFRSHGLSHGVRIANGRSQPKETVLGESTRLVQGQNNTFKVRGWSVVLALKQPGGHSGDYFPQVACLGCRLLV